MDVILLPASLSRLFFMALSRILSLCSLALLFVRSFVRFVFTRTEEPHMLSYRPLRNGQKRSDSMDGKKRRKDEGHLGEAIVSLLSILTALTQGLLCVCLCVCEVTPSEQAHTKTNEKTKTRRNTKHKRWNTVHCSLCFVLLCDG